MAKAKELRDLGLEELKSKEKELRQELFNVKLQRATGQVGNTTIVVKTKRELARVKTIIKETERAGEKRVS
jgi:large subunit ribosomal protein L29